MEGTNALAHALDTEDPAKLQLLLDHDPGNEISRSLLWAIYRDRSARIIRTLVEHGADPEARDPQNDRTPYGLAWRMGRPDLCELLAELGARRQVGPIDELLGHCFAGDAAAARRLAREDPDRAEQVRTVYFEALHQAAAEGRADAVAILLDLGVPIDLPGEMGGTPLHHAAWWGHGDVVDVLLAAGADPRRRAEPGTGSTPLAWAAHGSFHSPGPVAGGGTDHLRIAEALVGAGADPEAGMVAEAHEELAEWLRAWLEDRADPSIFGVAEPNLAPTEATSPAAAATPPAAQAASRAAEPHADAEASWAAHAEWLRRIADSPGAEARPVGDGFAVLTGLHSNAENGVVCDEGADDDAIADLVAWFQAAGAPAQWLVGRKSPLGPRLVAAGCRAERSAVVMGAAVADLPVDARPPEGVEIREAKTAEWLAAADALALVTGPAVPGVTRLIATRDGAPVGLASAFAVGDTLFLQHLEVVEAERRRGIGRALTAARVRAAPDCSRAVLDPTPDSVAFHRRLGFELRPFEPDRVYYLPLRERAG